MFLYPSLPEIVPMLLNHTAKKCCLRPFVSRYFTLMLAAALASTARVTVAEVIVMMMVMSTVMVIMGAVVRAVFVLGTVLLRMCHMQSPRAQQSP